MGGRLDPNFLLPPWLIASLFGLLFGSFLNVCIYRVPRDLSIVWPGSSCPSCGSPIAWYDNLPILSFLILRGRCRHCAQAIGYRYLAVEAATALLFGYIAAWLGFTLESLKGCLFVSILMVLFWTDTEERLLPDEFTLGGTLVGLILAAFVPMHSALAASLIPSAGSRVQSLFNSAAGAIVLAVPLAGLGWLYQRVRRRVGLGMGDVKLLLLIGAFLGVERGLVALLIGSLSGSVVGVTYILVRRKDPRTYQLPFGSFLCAGAAISALWNAEINGLLGVR
jgi:leader peptidase (prepilin peptidase)/N-methyltransferase